MSASFYCSARRPAPLSADEQQAVSRILAKYSVESRIKRFAETGQGIRWRPWRIYSPAEFTAADTILEGSAELPCESEEDLATALVHWCNLATALRREVHKALWEVRVDDREIKHDWRSDQYDPAA